MTEELDKPYWFDKAALKTSVCLTLRDWLAGLAMNGWAARNDYSPRDLESMAAGCYAWADAMLAEREKKK